MIEVTFVAPDGGMRTVSAAADASVMEAALANDVGGILADCGGCMSCATCHVYIDEAWIPAVGTAGENESAMLEMAIDPRGNSRLSCQVKLTEALSGLVVHIPESQI